MRRLESRSGDAAQAAAQHALPQIDKAARLHDNASQTPA